MIRRPIVPALLLIAAGLSCDVQSSGPSSKVVPGQARPGVTEVATPSPETLANAERIYVPIYSHVYTADTAQPLNLAATLFVRNTDSAGSIVLSKVQYYDSGGKLVRDFMGKPLKIGPMSSMDFFIKESDTSGGASPSFLVEWVSDGALSRPFAESVMIGTAGTQGISFTCPGRVVSTRKP